jgi:hypothetical protein
MADIGSSSAITDLLAGLGITAALWQDNATQAIELVLREHQIDAKVTSIRWSCATIEADSINAAKANWHRDSLVTAARTASEDRINRVRVRVVHTPTGNTRRSV